MPDLVCTVFFGRGTQDAAGDSCGDDPRGDVLCDDASRADHTAFSDGDASADHGVGADPDIFFDGDGGGGHDPPGPPRRIHGMPRACNADTRADERVLINMDRGRIQDDAVVIDHSQPVGVDIEAVVAAEGGLDKSQGMTVSEKLLQQFGAPL